MNKRSVLDWEILEWNYEDNGAIPLPMYQIDDVFIWDRWYVPDEVSVSCAGWIYQLVQLG